MIIDSHSHVILPVEKHLDIMAKEGIDKTVLFSTSIHPENAANYSEYKKELTQLHKIISGEVNSIDSRISAINELKQITNAYPDKFVGFGSYPLGLDLAQTEDWINKYIIGNSFKGIGELTVSEGQIKQDRKCF